MKNCKLCGDRKKTNIEKISICETCQKLLASDDPFISAVRKQRQGVDEFKFRLLLRECRIRNITEPSLDFIMSELGLSKVQAYRYRKFLIQELSDSPASVVPKKR